MMKFEKSLNKTLEVFLVILMSVLVLDVLWQVISRYLLASPSSFTDELAGYLLIWVGMLGAAYVAGRQEHLAIDILLQRSRPPMKKRLSLIIHVMILLFALAVMVVGGIILMYTRFVLEVKSAALQLPLGYVYIVMPISGLIILYYKILHIQEVRKST
jgi:TRAP-type C4-dicarboxylate transport system permease small subunit